MNMQTNQRILLLRKWMEQQGIQAFITPTTDPHAGEYVPDHWKSRSWISGFDGSAGTAVVTTDKAALWTDNRYFLQAAEQLSGSEFELMKDGLESTPTIESWLANTLRPGSRVGVDAWCYTTEAFERLASSLQRAGIEALAAGDPYDTIWTDRPAIPTHPVELHPLKYAGEDTRSKLERIREAIRQENADALIIPQLHEIAWTLNMRGTDVEYTPLFVSYLLVTSSDATLYINAQKLNDTVRHYLDTVGVDIRNYTDLAADLSAYGREHSIMYHPGTTNYGIASAIAHATRVAVSPVAGMVIMKNETEIKGYHSAMIKDGIAMVKWMKWVVPAVAAGGQTELSLSQQLEAFRAEQPLFRGVSFASIMGYGAHAAIVHYEPTPETDIPVLPKGLLLIDSGGQYTDGTTDITRTIPLGPLTYEERRDYTLVLRGWINLGRAVFPRGTYGTQLDALARTPMWQYGINYLHGTGHGVGSYLSVHEGPHQFRMNYMPTPLVPGMTITDEPGIYIAGSHGVRHENTMLVIDAQPKDCNSSEGQTFGPYYTFEHLTLCPILTGPILVDMLQSEERTWFNQYQQTVYDKLAPHLDEEHRTWLYEVTRPI